MGFIAIVMCVVVFAIVIRVIAGTSDRSRIEREIGGRGGRVISIHWEPLGKGWWGEKNDRIYSVEYEDRDGLRHKAWCKTSMLSGVYFSEDEVVGGAAPGTSPEDLRREIERLKAENDVLRGRGERDA